jgi:hypothetical protein
VIPDERKLPGKKKAPMSSSTPEVLDVDKDSTEENIGKRLLATATADFTKRQKFEGGKATRKQRQPPPPMDLTTIKKEVESETVGSLKKQTAEVEDQPEPEEDSDADVDEDLVHDAVAQSQQVPTTSTNDWVTSMQQGLLTQADDADKGGSTAGKMDGDDEDIGASYQANV